MTARRASLTASVALGALLLAPSVSAGATTSGLRGLVTRSPITPVCMEGVPCSAPARNIPLVFTRLGRTVTTRTDGDGRYRVALAPGAWSVRAASVPRIGTGIRPSSVRVLAGRFRVVNLDIDTGIR
jgi:hypothetical protein